MKKSYRIAEFVIPTLIIAVLLVFFIYTQYFSVKPMLAQLGVDSSKIDKIEIFSGGTGVKKIITDKDAVSDIVHMFDSVDVKYYKSINELTSGFSYSVSFYISNSRLASVTLRSDDEISENKIYKVVKGKYDLSTLSWYCQSES